MVFVHGLRVRQNNFYTYVGTEVLDNQVTELKKEFRGHKYWHKYSDKQIKELKSLIQFIGERNDIDVRKVYLN
jgi:hypothetical protein